MTSISDMKHESPNELEKMKAEFQEIKKKVRSLEKALAAQKKINSTQESINGSMQKIIAAMDSFRASTQYALEQILVTLEMHQGGISSLEQLCLEELIPGMKREDLESFDTLDLSLPPVSLDDKKMN